MTMRRLDKLKAKMKSVWVWIPVALVLPLIMPSQYWAHMYFMTILWAILASSLNIAIGYTGLSNMSHASFFGIGAYTAALLAQLGVPFYLTLLAGGAVAAAFGILLGLPSLRLRGMHLALATIGFGEIVRLVEINWIRVTNGPMGISGINGANLFGFEFGKTAFCYYALIVLGLELLIIANTVNSRIGRAWRTIKGDEIAANSIGINTTRYKILAFAMSAMFAGVAGTLYAHYFTFVSPSFTMSDSYTMLSMVIIGGAGTLQGPIIGAIILAIMPEIFRFADIYRMILIGVIMIIGVLIREGDLRERLRTLVGHSRRPVGLAKGGDA
jgi:branched-chain amino acid transport system permease protein